MHSRLPLNHIMSVCPGSAQRGPQQPPLCTTMRVRDGTCEAYISCRLRDSLVSQLNANMTRVATGWLRSTKMPGTPLSLHTRRIYEVMKFGESVDRVIDLIWRVCVALRTVRLMNQSAYRFVCVFFFLHYNYAQA